MRPACWRARPRDRELSATHTSVRCGRKAKKRLFRPRQIRQTLQSLGSGFIIDPGGYIVTNQHVVERAADLKIHVTTNDGKTYNAHYIAGDDKTDLAFIKIDAQSAFPFISLDNISPNLLGQTVIVVGNAVGYGS